jgi:hypothetical protein
MQRYLFIRKYGLVSLRKMDNVEETRLENLSHHARTTSFVDVVRLIICLGIRNRSQAGSDVLIADRLINHKWRIMFVRFNSMKSKILDLGEPLAN